MDRYKKSRKKTKWQIGRDYELYVGYQYAQKGYDVDYFGSYMGLEDLGRDIIAKKGEQVLIIQCKYWSEKNKYTKIILINFLVQRVVTALSMVSIHQMLRAC